ncbi:hypothetical protein GOP47_0027378 [Adiantum capillus-veneris]|nr:hypothetical protein GOP47_0027378 [Adiantum capillus-veneris]
MTGARVTTSLDPALSMAKRKYYFSRVKPSKVGRTTTCMQEMFDFLNCLPRNSHDADRCAKQRDALNACYENDGKGNERNSLNYYLSMLCKRKKR